MCGFVRVFSYRPYNQIDANPLEKPRSVAESDSSPPKILSRGKFLTIMLTITLTIKCQSKVLPAHWPVFGEPSQ